MLSYYFGAQTSFEQDFILLHGYYYYYLMFANLKCTLTLS